MNLRSKVRLLVLISGFLNDRWSWLCNVPCQENGLVDNAFLLKDPQYIDPNPLQLLQSCIYPL